MDRKIKISVVTVCYNSEKYIQQTIDAVATQDYPFLEHIVIDGGSKDGTVGILKENSNKITFISEPDLGIYDAMNKGIKLASGDVIGTLGAGDFYPNNQVISYVAAGFEQFNTDAIYGDKQFVSPDNLKKIVRFWRAGEYHIENWLSGWMPPHQSFYLRKSVIEKYGNYNISFRSAGDYELMLRILYKNKATAKYINKLFTTMLTGGVSSASIFNRIKANMEDRRAWKINELKPKWYTLFAKPLGKLGQFLKL